MSAETATHERLGGRLVMIGFGSIGQAMLPLALKHFGIQPGQVTIVKKRKDQSGIGAKLGVKVIAHALDPSNYQEVLGSLLAPGDFLLNLSVDVSSLALIELCARRGVLYLDTCDEPWRGRYDDPSLTPAQRSNYALREEILAWRRSHPAGPAAVVTQGANPGLVSSLLKQALLEMARDTGMATPTPASRAGWGGLARRLGIKVIHVAERDTQVCARRKARGEFVNTWSTEAFIDEGLQPAELGWGSHERNWPADAARHGYGSDAAIYLNRPGFATRVRSWTPLQGSYHGFLITHAESISIADYLTLREDGAVAYRPTVHYAYYPCDDAVLSLHEIAGRDWQPQPESRILRDAIHGGIDELGVLLLGNARGAYWYGSRLSIAQARELLPYNNATSLQVAAGILGGMVWALRHPSAGMVEPDEIDHETVLRVARPYLGDVVGVWGDWTPLKDRSPLYSEETDRDDPWQFLNFRVN
jgi:homospermidine synthase